jgi:hypothetical protein
LIFCAKKNLATLVGARAAQPIITVDMSMRRKFPALRQSVGDR